MAQTVTPTINGTPPPFTFTGDVTQTGQNFNFTGGGSFSTITSGTNTSTLVIGSGGSLSTTGTGTISATTATTTPNSSDSSTAASTNQFVQNAIQLSMATVPLSITGGIYSFDSQGSGATVVVGVSGGAVSSIITWVGGTGYAVGDIVTVSETGSNFDAYIRINAVTSGAPTSGTIVYGGTGYSSFGGYSATPAISSIPFTFLLSGTLTSNAQFIMTHGTYLTQSNQWILANNTTGAFTTNICVAGATDACAGGRTVTLAQGTNNSTSRILQTDGELNVDSSEAGLLLAGLPASFSSIIDSGLTPGTAPVCPNGTGGLLTTTGCLSLLAPLSANQFLGSLTAVAPTGQNLPSCSTSASALNYTSGTGFSCNTAVQADNVTGVVAVANGGTADTGTQWSQTTPTPTCLVGTPTTISSLVRVKTIGKTAFLSVQVTDTTNGTCASVIMVQLPFTSISLTSVYCRENALTGFSGAGTISAAASQMQITNYINATFAATGAVVNCSGVVETQ